MKRISEMLEPDAECSICDGDGWCCENHPSQPAHECEYCEGAEMPCYCTGYHKMTETSQQKEDGTWGAAVPLPMYYGFLPWAWKRLTGWRDQYGRKAQLFLPWQ